MSRGWLPATLGLVLRTWKVVYVTTPKAACTSLLWTLAAVQEESLDGVRSSLAPEVTRAMAIHDFAVWRNTRALQQLTEAEWQEIANDRDWLIFCVSRHPVSRLWSAWQSKLLMREPHYLAQYSSRPWFPRVPRRMSDVASDFRTFVDALQTEPALIDSDPHWRPQADLLHAETFPYTHVGKVEELAETIHLLEKHLRHQGWGGSLLPRRENKMPLPLASARLEPELARSIEQLYAADLRVFGYSSMASGLKSGVRRTRSAGGLVSAVRQIIERNERISDVRETAVAVVRSQRQVRPSVSVILAAKRAADAERQARLLNLPDRAELVVLLGAYRDRLPGDCSPPEALSHWGARVLRVSAGASLAQRLAWGIDSARGDVVITCRDLVSASEGWWPQVQRALAREETGLVTGVLSPSYAPDVACLGLRLVDRVLNCRWVTGPVPERDQPAPLVSVMFAAVRRDVLAASGGIDAGLVGQGYEGVDLSLRLWRMGYTCILVPTVRIVSDFRASDKSDRRPFLLNLLRFAAIHLDEPDLASVISALRDDPLLPDVLTQVTLSDVGGRRETVKQLSRHDFSWFCRRFPPDVEVDA